MNDDSYIVLMAPIQYATFRAFTENQNRNWRRIKREMNKAAKKARQNLTKGEEDE